MGEKPKKEKKAKKAAAAGDASPTAAAAPAVERKAILAPIAKPLADDKLSKKVRGSSIDA
jgi:hypothetical protein